MVHALHSSLFFCLSTLWITHCILPWTCCANLVVPANDELINATDARIQYHPPLGDTTVWSAFNSTGSNGTGVQTPDGQATASFTFQGTSILLFAEAGPTFPTLLITLDGEQFTKSDFEKKHATELMVDLTAAGSELDFSVNHTVVIQKSLDDSSDTAWNILALSFTPSASSPSPITSFLASTSLPTFSNVQTSSSKASAGISSNQHSSKISGGAIAGAVIGALLGVGLVGFVSVCLRRRHRQMLQVAPEPLVIAPAELRRDRPRFHRLYSDRFPHFTAPPSIWPTSGVRTSMSVAHPLPIARESLHEKITPFMLPNPVPQILTPSPPRQRKPRRPRYSSFFIANPSSHSSRSARSQSLQNQHIPKNETGPPMSDTKPTPWIEYMDEKDSKEHNERVRAEQGQQRADNFEIDPVPASRPTQSRITRAQSLRRFFFTTNPNPSTSSTSSTTSSGKRRSSKRAAVADYVRGQMYHKSRAGIHPSSTPLPLSVPAPVHLPPSAIPKADLALPVQQTVTAPPPRTRNRQSQTLFFTTNPGPSTQDLASERAEAGSVLSDAPPPRKDKGKGRAF